MPLQRRRPCESPSTHVAATTLFYNTIQLQYDDEYLPPPLQPHVLPHYKIPSRIFNNKPVGANGSTEQYNIMRNSGWVGEKKGID